MSTEAENSSDDEPISQDTLYMSLASAWMDLNDFSKNGYVSYFKSALSTLKAYIGNGGDKNRDTFKKLLGRICYEHSNNLSQNEKDLLGIGHIIDIQNYGLSLLNDAAKVDSEAEDYLMVNGL